MEVKKSNAILFFGLGYIGSITITCLPLLWDKKKKFDIIGIEKDSEKLNSLMKNKIPIYEPSLQDIYDSNLNGERRVNYLYSNRINNTMLASYNIEYIFICVDTPVSSAGEMNIENIKNVFQEIKETFSEIKVKPTIIIRSTIPPNNIDNIFDYRDFNEYMILHHPEFLREGDSVNDFLKPNQVIFGLVKYGLYNRDIQEVYKDLYSGIIDETTFGYFNFNVSSSMKYINNSFHALKISFANEMAKVFKEKFKLKIEDMDVVFNIFTQDKKLNISKNYLIPGSGFGGSCLPKELRLLAHSSSNLFDDVLRSNLKLIDYFSDKIIKHQKTFYAERKEKKTYIVFIGTSFKYDTEDIRESQNLKLAIKLEDYYKKNFEKENIGFLILKNFEEYENIAGNKEFILFYVTPFYENAIEICKTNNKEIICLDLINKEYNNNKKIKNVKNIWEL